MLKKVEYETKDVNEIFIDIAEEIKNGWKLYSFNMPCFECSLSCNPNITMEVSFSKVAEAVEKTKKYIKG